MFVLDCSVALAWCLPDEQDSYADRVLELLVDQQAIVPEWWHLEVINVLLVAQRRERVAAEKIHLILQMLNDLNISSDQKTININDAGFLAFCQQHQVTGHDATYLYLAQRENLPLATLDEKLKSVAEDMGVYLRCGG